MDSVTVCAAVTVVGVTKTSKDLVDSVTACVSAAIVNVTETRRVKIWWTV